MWKNRFGAFVGLLLCCSTLAAQEQGQSKKQISQGRTIYMSYCASCHGVDASGNGMVAPSLKKQPSDLTRIKKEDGRFPAPKVRGIITGEMVLPVHGEKEMPVWGGILKDQDLTHLVKYLESIQRPVELPPRG